MESSIKIVLLGDSITQGIGSKMINYSDRLNEILADKGISCEITNLAMTGTTIDYALSLLDNIKEIDPHYIVIMYGSVDLQVRPNQESNRFWIRSLTPKRYKNIKGMLNPRPFMSHRKGRYILDKIDNIYRKFWRNVVLLTQGTMQYLSIEEFKQKYNYLLNELCGYKLIVLSTVYLDETIYLNSNDFYKSANSIMKIAAENHENTVYVDLYDQFRTIVESSGWESVYCKDHFHPNNRGYDICAQAISEAIERNEV